MTHHNKKKPSRDSLPVSRSSNPSHSERRTETRHRTTTDLPVAFYNKGKLYEGIICNLSEKGACLMVIKEATGEMPSFARGKAMECYVSTPDGTSKFRGKIQWYHTAHDELMWGIYFLELPEDTIDPFNLTLNSTCNSHKI